MKNKAAVAAAATTLLVLCASAKRVVMPWMCLERCGEDVQRDLAQLIALGPSVVPWVSIEAYDLVFNASIKDCGYSRVGPQLKQAGISVHPMITTANILKLRDLWKDPAGFIEQAMEVARANRAWMDGFNIDFEPENGETPTHADAVRFASFLDKFARALHAEGFKLTCDIANWSPLFEDKLLAQTQVDRFITMSTYTVNITRFEEIVKDKLRVYGTQKAGIGMQTLPKFTGADAKARLDAVRAADIDTVGIWMTPLPDGWIAPIKAFVNGP